MFRFLTACLEGNLTGVVEDINRDGQDVNAHDQVWCMLYVLHIIEIIIHCGRLKTLLYTWLHLEGSWE